MTTLPYVPTPDAEATVRASAREAAQGKPGPVCVAPAGGPPWAWRAFDDELVAAVVAEPDRRKTWSAVLSEIVAAGGGADAEFTVFEDERAAMRGALSAWADETDPLQVWRAAQLWGNWFVESGHSDRAARLLVRIDPAAGALALESSAHPGIASTVLMLAAREGGPSQLIPIVRESPRVLDDGGGWIDRRCVLFLTLDSLVVALKATAGELDSAVRVAMSESDQQRALTAQREWHRVDLPRLADDIAFGCL